MRLISTLMWPRLLPTHDVIKTLKRAASRRSLSRVFMSELQVKAATAGGMKLRLAYRQQLPAEVWADLFMLSNAAAVKQSENDLYISDSLCFHSLSSGMPSVYLIGDWFNSESINTTNVTLKNPRNLVEDRRGSAGTAFAPENGLKDDVRGASHTKSYRPPKTASQWKMTTARPQSLRM